MMANEELDRMKKKSQPINYYSSQVNSNNQFSNNSIGDTNSNMTSNSSFNSNENVSNQSSQLRDPFDINSSTFDPDMFLKRLIKVKLSFFFVVDRIEIFFLIDCDVYVKEKTLPEIMDIENDIVRETRKLDSEMQTLVSENYNKFISATDTIRKMRNDFKKMEDEMENLVSSMAEITEFNEKINSTFKEKRDEISRLSEIDTLLKKLQFLFDLPTKLNEFITDENYAMAVKYYCKARKTLDQYKHMPSFRGIEDDCSTMIKNLIEKLYERLNGLHNSTDLIGDSVILLSKLGEPLEKLCANYVIRIEKCLDGDLTTLNLNIDLLTSKANNKINGDNSQIAMDILEFIDYGCNKFLVNLSLTILNFNQMFIDNQNLIE